MRGKAFEIAGLRIGGGNPPQVIAELGINHGGDLSVAKEMALAAIKAGAVLIKHQTHIPEKEMSREAQFAIPGNASVSIFDVISECTLSEDEEFELARFIESNGAIFFSTPFSREAANRLNSFGVPAFKIGSGECNNYPLVEHIARFGKPVILSTGMNSISSIRTSVSILQAYDVPFALMHTTNLYPTPTKLVRLGAMQQMAEAFPSAPIGLSDHSTSNAAGFAAVALGATIVERHFTDSKSRVGPDIICSMDPGELAQLLQMSSEIFYSLGGVKGAAAEEEVTMNFAFASVASTRPIKA
ncbi:MAG: hypothetical protein RLZZ579_842, partial [Actinomycetota bacterium]